MRGDTAAQLIKPTYKLRVLRRNCLLPAFTHTCVGTRMEADKHSTRFGVLGPMERLRRDELEFRPPDSAAPQVSAACRPGSP